MNICLYFYVLWLTDISLLQNAFILVLYRLHSSHLHINIFCRIPVLAKLVSKALDFFFFCNVMEKQSPKQIDINYESEIMCKS